MSLYLNGLSTFRTKKKKKNLNSYSAKKKLNVLDPDTFFSRADPGFGSGIISKMDPKHGKNPC